MHNKNFLRTMENNIYEYTKSNTFLKYYSRIIVRTHTYTYQGVYYSIVVFLTLCDACAPLLKYSNEDIRRVK